MKKHVKPAITLQARCYPFCREHRNKDTDPGSLALIDFKYSEKASLRNQDALKADF